MRRLVVLLSILLITQCQDVRDWVVEWQQKQIEKRYGPSKSVKKEKIPQWQEDLREYEAELNKKIEAGQKSAKLYRMLGETFADLESYQLCADHLEAAVKLGYTTDDVFYKLGLCYGNLSRSHNWQGDFAKKAEQNLLKVLNLNPQYDRAKFQLGLVYFYGFSKNNRYRVAAEQLTISQTRFRQKAIKLILEYQNVAPGDHRSYFALAGMYKIIGRLENAQSQMQRLIQTLERENPKTYAALDIYQKARDNLRQLSIK